MSTDELTTDPALGIRFEHRMSDSDALMWVIEKDPMLRSTITTVVTVDGAVDRDAIWAQYERATRAIPRLRQRVRSNPLSVAPPRWEVDPNFDLGYHLRFARATGTGSHRDVLAMAEPIAMQGFDRARPLWETTVVEDLDGGGTAVIMKIHHAITDGVGGVQLMLEIFDLEPTPAARRPLAEPTVHVMNQAERFVDAFQHETRRQLGIAKRAVSGAVSGVSSALTNPAATAGSAAELADSALRILRPASAPLSPLMKDRSLSNHFSTVAVPLDRAKKTGKLIGGTLNDTFVSGIVLAMNRYH
ncbi:MAG: wax ester/triacylglycerol synthase domain-containing protein, partial [Actinomycetes bacterium]